MSPSLFSRRETILITVGGLAYGKIVASAISKIKRGDAYPSEHESRVSDVFKRTWMEAAAIHQQKKQDRPLRVLEAGIGSNCRTIVRGLYGDATDGLSKMDFMTGVDFIGIDIDPPSIEMIDVAREGFSNGNPSSSSIGPLSFNIASGDLVQGLLFPDDYFDAITCSLVLCSVADQMSAIKELKRVLNRDGGTFGYVEHVAVNIENNNEQDRSFLELQQRILDPLQQAVAHNCHLHRDTDRIIADTFETSKSGGLGKILQSERFFVDDMWPVSCQCSGVVKLQI